MIISNNDKAFNPPINCSTYVNTHSFNFDEIHDVISSLQSRKRSLKKPGEINKC